MKISYQGTRTFKCLYVPNCYGNNNGKWRAYFNKNILYSTLNFKKCQFYIKS